MDLIDKGIQISDGGRCVIRNVPLVTDLAISLLLITNISLRALATPPEENHAIPESFQIASTKVARLSKAHGEASVDDDLCSHRLASI